MALTLAYGNSASVSGTEYSFTNNSTSIAAQTTDGIYAALVYIASMAVGDQFEIRVLEKVLSGGTQREIWKAETGEPSIAIPALPLGNGWDITAKKIAGTDRTVEWAIWAVS